MAYLGDRAKMTTTDSGTSSSITLSTTPIASFQSFTDAGILQSSATQVPYCIEEGTAWETGQGLWDTTAATFERTTVSESSNSDNRISLAGAAAIFITPLAADLSTVDDWGLVTGSVTNSDDYGSV